MLAHFMLFSEADVEYRFLLATNLLMEEEVLKPLSNINKKDQGYFTSRFHKVSLALVNAKSKKNKNNLY